MIKYVMVNERTHQVIGPILADHTDELYADEAIRIMKSREDYNSEIHRLYLKVGQQEVDEG